MVRRFCDSVCMSVCPFAIKTTFPLSKFKTKHIFGILMTLRKFLKLWAPQAPPRRGVGPFPAAEGGGKWAPEAPKAPLPRRVKEIPSKAGISRVLYYVFIYII